MNKYLSLSSKLLSCGFAGRPFGSDGGLPSCGLASMMAPGARWVSTSVGVRCLRAPSDVGLIAAGPFFQGSAIPNDEDESENDLPAPAAYQTISCHIQRTMTKVDRGVSQRSIWSHRRVGGLKFAHFPAFRFLKCITCQTPDRYGCQQHEVLARTRWEFWLTQTSAARVIRKSFRLSAGGSCGREVQFIIGLLSPLASGNLERPI